jgi:transcriptional regulator with XRE-family HTH domain
MKSFGEMLREERISRKITLRKLSEYVGKSIGYLSDIEQDRKGPPDLETVRKIEEFFEIDNGKLIALASKLRRRVPKNVTQGIRMNPKLSEALLRADTDLTDEEFDDLMKYMDSIVKKRNG